MSIHLIYYKDISFTFQILKSKISMIPKYENKLSLLADYIEEIGWKTRYGNLNVGLFLTSLLELNTTLKGGIYKNEK